MDFELEFQESELIFADHDQSSRNHLHRHHHNGGNYFSYREIAALKKNKTKKKKKRIANSLPVNIPDNILQCVDTDDFFEEDYGEEEMVPPHVIVARRIAGKMAFSVCTGNGRTLKGRDLSEVRNSILRMTGFLET